MSIKKTERGSYFVRVQVGRRRISRTIRGNYTQARQLETKLRTELEDAKNNEQLGLTPKCTFGQACVKWGKSGAPESMKSHIRIVLIYLKDCQLVDVPAAAQDMKEVMLAEGLSNQTINRRLAVVKRVLNLCYREWSLLDRPLAEKVNKLPERNTAREYYLTPAEVDTLLEHCTNPQAANFIRLAAYTGTRKSELFRASSKDFKKGHLRINQSKSGKHRFVPVPKDLWPVCHALPFSMTEHELRVTFEAAREAIGRPEIRFHDLRHSYATWLLSKGVSAATVRDILGHSSLAVTSKYTHTLGIDIDEVFCK